MEYVTKICPICGNKFVVSKTAEEKAIYCTIECLAKAQKSLWHQEGCLSAVE
jgi:NAD-dependent DNA ligase